MSSSTIVPSQALPSITGFDVLERLYEGPQTVVYRALKTNNQQPVVIKLLRDEHPSFSDLVKFRNQYAIVQQLNQADIIQLYELNPYGNGYQLVMEDYGGIGLNTFSRNFCQAQVLDLEVFFPIALQITNILQSLYQHRVIHKDIKPANILIHPETHLVKLIDFAISTQLPKETQQIQSPNALEGTLAYMSPEQTGRMNRSIDYRSDYYSLGVTFYQLLTGKLPFQSDDPMELVHCHLAIQPDSVREINPAIPRFLSEIVAKLMAKNAEDRYQSALGIQHDLELGWQQLQTAGYDAVFDLGLKDITEHFLIPEKLYGREAEVTSLLETFERVTGQVSAESDRAAEVSSEFMLVAGFSGIGKTSVINEVQKPIVQERGYFISGKFDQFLRNVPYSAIVAAFKKLVEQLLSESEQKFQQWCVKLQQALGENAQVIIDVLPEVELLIGKQPPVPELGPTETQLRFNTVFQDFIRVFCQPEHPLVIFLDDLQWADIGTLKLIELMLSDQSIAPLFLIGAYRDNEVSESHPLILLLEQLKSAGTQVKEIFLQPLSLDHLSHLISDTLYVERSTVTPLAQLVQQKTDGNPFFANECLKALYQEHFLQFDGNTRQWQWDLDKIEARGITDDVVELMVDKLRKLPTATQEAISLAACIGATFDLTTLAIIAHQSQLQVYQDLLDAMQAGFILPTSKLDPELLIQHYRFGHDRIQQAAYTLIPKQQRQETHLNIGRSLLRNLNETEQSDRCFEIADHLNQGLALVTEDSERLKITRLNLQAAQKAKQSLAYVSALDYISTGTELLNTTDWENNATLARALYKTRVEIEYLCGNFSEAMTWAEATLEKSVTDLDKAEMYIQKLVLYVLGGDYAAGIETTYQAFEYVSIDVPADEDLDAETQKIRAQITDYLKSTETETGTDVTRLMDLPKMTDPVKMMALNLLNELLPATYVAKPEIFGWVVSTQVLYSIKYGLHPRSFLSFSCYGILLVVEEAYTDAYAFGDIALQLAQQWNEYLQITRTAHVLSAFLMSWTQSVFLVDDIRQLVKSDLSFMGYNHAECFASKIFQSCTIKALLDETRVIDRDVEAFENKYTEVVNAVYRFGLLALQGTPDDKISCDGKRWEETEFIQKCKDELWTAGLCTHHVMQSLIHYLNGDYAAAYDLTRKAEADIMTRRAGMIVPLFHFYRGLILVENYHLRPEEQSALSAELTTLIEQFQRWRDHCPENFDHLYQILMAEIARMQQQDLEAISRYDQAIAAASEGGFVQHEAMANECAGRFWLAKDKADFAQIYLTRAYYAYQKWGANAKVEQLKRIYGGLLSPALQQPSAVLSAGGSSVSMAASVSYTYQSNTTGPMSLDRMSVLKASQALSSEIEMESLLANLLKIVVETAGADYCAILLKEADQLCVEATMQVGQAAQIFQKTPFEHSGAVPSSHINIVKRSLEPSLIVDIQAHDSLTQDPYFQTHQPKSLLVIPLLNQGKLLGMVYLENKLTAAAFSPDRIEVLDLLCTQAAISLENARLYQKSQQYATQIENAQLQTVQSEKMASLGNLVAGVAHEINNPLGFLNGSIKNALNYVDDLQGQLVLYQEHYPNPVEPVQENAEDIDLEFVCEDLPKLLNSMKGATDRIKAISTSLRTFSRADTEHKVSANLVEGLDSTLLILKYRLKANEHRPAIEIIKHYDELPIIDCFPGRLNQVFMNLLANAIDVFDEAAQQSTFAELKSQPQTITVKAAVVPHEKAVEIRIADNGKGMPEAVKVRIFDHLFTTKGVGKGTGLGLAIARQIIVEAHGGTIDVQSQTGAGTEFCIRLPL